MCGICAYIGYNEAYGYIINGLKMLQNRGYDSAGICTINFENVFTISKSASTDTKKAISNLIDRDNYFMNSNIGIGHTRWSTHGGKTDTNAHPHLCYQNKFALVHNGIIENYLEIKTELQNNGIYCRSGTDTEVIVNLISLIYTKTHNVEDSIKTTINKLRGTWGLVILCTDTPDTIYAIRHGSPLLVGIGDDYAVISSEQSGFCKFVDNYKCISNNNLVVINKHNNKISYNIDCTEDIYTVSASMDCTDPYPYPHWTLKEIYEQYDSSKRAIGNGGRLESDSKVKLGGLMQHMFELSSINNLTLIGCGTSYYAGLASSRIFKKICNFNSVQVIDGGEFDITDLPKNDNNGIILLSQSGETRDLLNAIETIKNNKINAHLIGVINVVDSMITREVSCGVYLNSGREVGVASTKVFTSQIIVLYLIAIWFSQTRSINIDERRKLIHDIKLLPDNIMACISSVHDQIKAVAQNIYMKDHIFILGKGISEAIAKEGALKIKELSYIHAEGYSSSALKHGPYSLIEDGTCVIIINPDDEHYCKNCSVIEELKSRNAYVISITDTTNVTHINSNKADIIINIPSNNNFVYLLSVIPFQLLAYELAFLRKVDIDMPRNLAKSVTTD